MTGTSAESPGSSYQATPQAALGDAGIGTSGPIKNGAGAAGKGTMLNIASDSFGINNTGSFGLDSGVANQTSMENQALDNIEIGAKGQGSDNLEVADMGQSAGSMLNFENGVSQTTDNELSTAYDTNAQTSSLQNPEKRS